MKYSLSVWNPWLAASAVADTMPSCVTPLFIACRNRSEPASGARVIDLAPLSAKARTRTAERG